LLRADLAHKLLHEEGVPADVPVAGVPEFTGAPALTPAFPTDAQAAGVVLVA
jgi:hypothetical protein